MTQCVVLFSTRVLKKYGDFLAVLCGIWIWNICWTHWYILHTQRQWSIKMCTSKVRLDEKNVIVTGANTGLGLSTVIDLARRGATVVMACRNMSKGEKALEHAKKESGSKDIVLMKLDLSSLKSVRKFAKEFLSKYSKLKYFDK